MIHQRAVTVDTIIDLDFILAYIEKRYHPATPNIVQASEVAHVVLFHSILNNNAIDVHELHSVRHRVEEFEKSYKLPSTDMGMLKVVHAIIPLTDDDLDDRGSLWYSTTVRILRRCRNIERLSVHTHLTVHNSHRLAAVLLRQIIADKELQPPRLKIMAFSCLLPKGEDSILATATAREVHGKLGIFAKEQGCKIDILVELRASDST
jgi:hypothetical protein